MFWFIKSHSSFLETKVQVSSPVLHDSSFGGTTDLQKSDLERAAAFFSVVAELFLELPVFQWRTAAGSLGNSSPYKNSGPTNLLPLTIVIFLCGTDKKIYSCLSSTEHNILCKSKWSFQVIPSPALPHPASPLEFHSPIDLVSSPRWKENRFPLTFCPFLLLLLLFLPATAMAHFLGMYSLSHQ